MSMTKTRARKRRRAAENAPPCSNCGQPGKHYVLPSMGERGFFICPRLQSEENTP